MFKRIINIFLWTTIGLYSAIVVLLHIPVVQNCIGSWASDALCKKFGTKVAVGRVDLGFANRLIIDDSQMYDQQGKQMLKVARISVKINLLALANGQIEITSAQFFGLNANLYKATRDAKPNFQFVIDSLAPKDTTKEKTPLDLQINSLIIRHGNVRYRLLSEASPGRHFSTSDIDVSDISAHVIINRITDDSLNVKVKRIAFKEHSGLDVRSLKLHAIVSRRTARLEQLALELPHTRLRINNLSATYQTNGNAIEMPTLRFEGDVDAPEIAPADLAFLLPSLGKLTDSYALGASVYGTGSSLNVSKLSLTGGKDLALTARAALRNFPDATEWAVNLDRLRIGQPSLQAIYSALTSKDLPGIIGRLGNVDIKAFAGGNKRSYASNATIQTDLGMVRMAVDKQNRKFTGHLETTHFNIAKLTDNGKLGKLSANVNVNGTSKDDFDVRGKLFDIEYNGYSYRDVDLNARYGKKVLEGIVGINDPNVRISLNGTLDNRGKVPDVRLETSIDHLSPNALKLTNKWAETTFAANISANIKGSNINNADGEVRLSNFTMHSPSDHFALADLSVRTGYENGSHFLDVDSDFGNVDIVGHFSYETLARSVLNLVASKLPTMPGLTRVPQKEYNDFTINATINDTKWMRSLLGVPLDIDSPLNLSGEMDDRRQKFDLWCDVPSFSYGGNRFRDAFINIETPGDTLQANIRIKKLSAKGKALSLNISANAADNNLCTTLRFNNNERHPLHGVINASTVFRKNEEGLSTAYVDIAESRATIGDTTWHVKPAKVVYYKNHLQVSDFAINHDGQFIKIDGTATNNVDDSLRVRLNDIDVSYIMNLINFHSVDFFGMASGDAYVAGVFSKTPKVAADLQVKDFLFETGRMGTLFAHIGYNDTEGKIEIDATAKDGDERRTFINGYVSPKHNYIDLAIKAKKTRAEFMESFCGSFMDNVNADLDGNVNVVGPLNNINLVGEAVVNGSVRMSALGTTYWMHGDTVRFVPDEIKFDGATITDRDGHVGVMSGSVYHKHLTNLSYDLGIKAKKLLAYDTHTFDGNSFYGTAYVTGDCAIKGKSGEVTIDVNATPEKNSILVYNVTDHSTSSSRDYIHWRTRPDITALASQAEGGDGETESKKVNLATNIRINFLVNCNPNATLKIIMDETTGDYISLHGDGVLRATYFNKGSFDIYGNYVIDNGVYKLTIQNIIKKDFVFQKGGFIAFGGNPYNAALDLKATYILNSVSLSDLNIGRSFSNNNVRVNCLMDITGTPEKPKVDFNLDIPSLSNDAKQMVYSLLNAEEEMNQQVLYLLAVGRFYSQGNNNSADGGSQQYSQTSLAMQSFISGTISQQINNVLSNAINSSNWNFGANISTGTEGFNDAEYEGLLSGRLLNNRLLINGQFGYRDNPNATTSFIGDFDLKYLLFPNGNLAISVYNKTNDRYFTRNSLNTQGIGLIMKKDFTRFTDLFFSKKKSGKKKSGKTKEDSKTKKK